VTILDMLIICIDKDDDIGVKAGVKSPVVGRDACLDAAARLGAADPEDSDVNTIYGGINVYDQLRSEGMDVEVVCFAGHRELGLKSDRAIAQQLDDFLLSHPVEKAVLVSDGAEDESVMPILQSRVKVESVRRIVVKQAQNLESTYYIIKELASDPKVARVIFIPAGVTFLVYAVDSLLKTNAAPMAIATMIGSYLLYKGLSLDSLLETFVFNLRKSFSEAKLTFVTYLISLILIVMAFVRGSLDVLDKVVTEASQPGIINLAAVFFNSAIWWFVVALLAVVIGWIIDAYTEDSESLHKYLATPFFLVAMGTLVWGGTQYILDMQDKMPEALKSLGIAILVAVVVSYLGVTFARYVRNLNQYRIVEVIDF
jgi:putative membrane protein